jgi:group I intron endonuclease
MTEQNSGIYIFEHLPTGKQYVGASSNLKRRKYQHLRSLHLGYSHNEEMQIDFQQSAIGNSAMDFRVIEYCEVAELGAREKSYIEAINPAYNVNVGGGGIREVSDNFREQMRKRLTGVQIRKVGTFITPFGEFPSSAAVAQSSGLISQAAAWNACRKSSTEITRNAFVKSAYLQANFDENVVGKTWAEIGFSFVSDGRK